MSVGMKVALASSFLLIVDSVPFVNLTVRGRFPATWSQNKTGFYRSLLDRFPGRTTALGAL